MEGSSASTPGSAVRGDGSRVKVKAETGSNVTGAGADAGTGTGTVKITVQKQNTKDVIFNVKRNVPLGKLMLNYCLELGLNYQSFKFTYLGKQVKDYETPLDLQMEDQDILDCWDEQTGGHARDYYE